MDESYCTMAEPAAEASPRAALELQSKTYMDSSCQSAVLSFVFMIVLSIHLFYVCVEGMLCGICHSTSVDVRGQLEESVGSLFLICGFLGSDSGHET